MISDNISYSLAKAFDDEGPQALIRPRNITGQGVFFGKIFDDYLYMDKEEFNDNYEILPMAPLDKPATRLAEIMRETYKLEDIDNIEKDDALKLKVVELIKANGLWKNIKTTTTFLRKFNFSDFYDYVRACYLDKNIIFTSDLLKLKEGQGSLYTNKRTKDYFLNDYDNIYQLEINYNYKKQNVKAILDMVIIDHKNKVIKGVDLKTGAPKPEEFTSNFFKFKYYLQAAIYQRGLEKYNKEHFNGEYTIENFRFLYMCRTDIGRPLIYIVSDKWIEAGWKGFTTASGFKYRGLDELIDEIVWHKENKLFEFTRDVYENSEVRLEDFYINVND